MPDVSLNGIEFVIKGSSDGASSSVDRLNKKLNSLSSALSKVSSLTKKAFTFPLTQAASKVKNFTKSLSGVISSFKRILGYRIIRSIIKEITQGFAEGVKNLYGWSSLVNGKFKTSMDTISTSMSYFKNSIGAAVAPIVNALAPAVDFLIDKIVALINVINQLFALLTGAGSWTRAKKKAQEYGDAVSGAGGAAKEALKYLAPFDELNRLPDDNKGGGGGGSSTDYSGMFEDVTEFTEGITDFATAIREAIAAGDWQGLGTLIGEKVNEVIENINWSGIGTWVGEKINALFTTEYWTLKTINFQNIGAKIAEFFNSAIAVIDFSVVGGTIAQKLTILPDLFIGAVNNLNFKNVGTAIGNIVKGFFNDIADWAMEVDWTEFISNLVSGLVDLLDGLDVVGIVESGLRVATSVVNGIIEGIYGVLDGIYNTVVEYFSGGDFWSGLKNTFAEKWNDFANWANQYLPSNFQLPTIPVDIEPVDGAFDHLRDALQADATANPIDVDANGTIKKVKNALESKPNISSTANLNSASNKLTGKKKPGINTNALLNNVVIDKNIADANGYMKIKSAAEITKVHIGYTPTIDVTARVRQTQAGGGIYTGNGWRPITSYAGGGSPFGGQIFRARENGNPELVGTLKGSTAVMNNDQIVASVSSGVAKAIAGISFQLRGLPTPSGVATENNEETLYRAMLRALNEADREIEIDLDGDPIYRSVVNRNRKETFRTGVNPLMSRA